MGPVSRSLCSLGRDDGAVYALLFARVTVNPE